MPPAISRPSGEEAEVERDIHGEPTGQRPADVLQRTRKGEQMRTIALFSRWLRNLFTRERPVSRTNYYTADHIASILEKFADELGIVVDKGENK